MYYNCIAMLVELSKGSSIYYVSMFLAFWGPMQPLKLTKITTFSHPTHFFADLIYGWALTSMGAHLNNLALILAYGLQLDLLVTTTQ